MNADKILSQFNATGVETCFHDRHINPQIFAGLNGSNWSLKDYEARGGYQALRKILGKDGAAPSSDTGVVGMTQDQVIATVKEFARSWWCGFPHRTQVELHASPVSWSEIPGLQLGRR
jgi:NADH-quinone oxidoreductase subunit F